MSDTFKITLPDQSIAEVKHILNPHGRYWTRDGFEGPPFEVWITEGDNTYCSAGVATFEAAVRNVMGPVWSAAMPFIDPDNCEESP